MPRDAASAEDGAAVARRVAAARGRMASRLAGTPWRTNGQIPGAELRKSFCLRPAAVAGLEKAVEAGRITPRDADGVIRVAWTLADLSGEPRPTGLEVAGALALRLGTTASANAGRPSAEAGGR